MWATASFSTAIRAISPSARALETLLDRLGQPLDIAIKLDVPTARSSARCEIRFAAEHRPDDDPAIVRKRLDVYRAADRAGRRAFRRHSASSRPSMASAASTRCSSASSPRCRAEADCRAFARIACPSRFARRNRWRRRFRECPCRHSAHLIRDICLLRRGPQDLPYSAGLLAQVAALCVDRAARPWRCCAARRSAACWPVRCCGWCSRWVRCNLHAEPARPAQPLRAGRRPRCSAAPWCSPCSVCRSRCSSANPPITPEQLTPLQLLLGLVSLPLLIWKIIVDAHVFRHSLDVPFLAGIVIALLWIVAAMVLSGAVRRPAGRS